MISLRDEMWKKKNWNSGSTTNGNPDRKIWEMGLKMEIIS